LLLDAKVVAVEAAVESVQLVRKLLLVVRLQVSFLGLVAGDGGDVLPTLSG
jgi:hypothetical protein